jgi:hypothetical protein
MRHPIVTHRFKNIFFSSILLFSFAEKATFGMDDGAGGRISVPKNSQVSTTTAKQSFYARNRIKILCTVILASTAVHVIDSRSVATTIRYSLTPPKNQKEILLNQWNQRRIAYLSPWFTSHESEKQHLEKMLTQHRTLGAGDIKVYFENPEGNASFIGESQISLQDLQNLLNASNLIQTWLKEGSIPNINSIAGIVFTNSSPSKIRPYDYAHYTTPVPQYFVILNLNDSPEVLLNTLQKADTAENPSLEASRVE